MNITYFISWAVATAAGGIITFLFAYYFLKNDINQYLRQKSGVATAQDHAHLLPLRLQAHERLIVFVERLNPANLFVRLYQPGISATVLQALILNEVRSEYQHNVTQQLYVSAVSWNVVRKLKEDTISMINNAVSGLSEEATGAELSKKVLSHLSTVAENPYDLTLELIKQDIHQFF